MAQLMSGFAVQLRFFTSIGPQTPHTISLQPWVLGTPMQRCRCLSCKEC
jgi:hypothetical protein